MRMLAVSLTTLALVGCGAARPSPQAAKAPVAAPSTNATPTTAPAARVTLTRSGVHAAVSQGLGVLLQRVDVDDQPVLVGGRFHGFRLAALRDPDFWSGVDLKPGDVITSVNGFPIERPEQAQTALESLELARELRVAYERDGQPRELVYAIVDDR